MSCHVIFRLSLNMSILKYFKPKNVLSSPEGPLSCEVPLSNIQAAHRSFSTISINSLVLADNIKRQGISNPNWIKSAEYCFIPVTLQEMFCHRNFCPTKNCPRIIIANKLNLSYWGDGQLYCCRFIENGSCPFPVSLAHENISPSSGIHIDRYTWYP